MRAFLAALSFLGLLTASPLAAQEGPVVIELYTSQGCSSCPPADAMLDELADRDDVIALAFHVDYWDYLGWQDIFASPENTRRQHGYARAAKETTVYTPQMVINGQDIVVGSRTMEVMELIQAHQERGQSFAIDLQRNGDRLIVQAAAGPQGNYVVQLVRYIPEATVDIRRGENAGKTFRYVNIVSGWGVIGAWDGGAPLYLEADATGEDAVVVLVQQANFGPIVGAAALR